MRTTLKIVVNGIGIYLASVAARPSLRNIQQSRSPLMLWIRRLLKSEVPPVAHPSARVAASLTEQSAPAFLPPRIPRNGQTRPRNARQGGRCPCPFGRRKTPSLLKARLWRQRSSALQAAHLGCERHGGRSPVPN